MLRFLPARLLMRHFPPILVSSGVITFAWLALATPVMAVFLVDGDFVIKDFIKCIFYAIGVSLGISAGIFFPLAALGEWLVRKNPARYAVAPPVFMMLIALGCLIFHGDFPLSLLDWPGLLLVLSSAFTLYWIMLWIGKGLLRTIRKCFTGCSRDSISGSDS